MSAIKSINNNRRDQQRHSTLTAMNPKPAGDNENAWLPIMHAINFNQRATIKSIKKMFDNLLFQLLLRQSEPVIDNKNNKKTYG